MEDPQGPPPTLRHTYTLDELEEENKLREESLAQLRRITKPPSHLAESSTSSTTNSRWTSEMRSEMAAASDE